MTAPTRRCRSGGRSAGAHLLRRHVVEAADQRAGVGDAGIGQLGDAEVEDLQAAAPLLDHQVGRLDVAVDDGEAVRVGQAVAQLLQQPQLAGDGGRLLAPDPHRQRLAVDVLHGDERLAVLLADVEDADDVLVLEHAGGVRFLHEAARISSLSMPSLSSLMATVRPPIFGSRAQGVPIPPEPIEPTIS